MLKATKTIVEGHEAQVHIVHKATTTEPSVSERPKDIPVLHYILRMRLARVSVHTQSVSLKEFNIYNAI